MLNFKKSKCPVIFFVFFFFSAHKITLFRRFTDFSTSALQPFKQRFEEYHTISYVLNLAIGFSAALTDPIFIPNPASYPHTKNYFFFSEIK